MPAPISPDELKNSLPDPSLDECTAVSKALLEFPTKIWQLISWMLDSAGEISAAFVKALNLVKPGDLIFSASPLDESGRILCNGATISRVTYADLFAKIGTLYGAGDGSTTFKIPDFRDRFPVMASLGGDYELGDKGGVKETTLTMANLPSMGANVTSVFVSVSSGAQFTIDTGLGSWAHASVAYGGSSAPFNNRPPYFGVYVYLKT